MAKKAEDKSTRKDNGLARTDNSFPTLRRAAALYYQNEHNLEPCRPPEPEVQTRGATKRVLGILGDLKREGVHLEDLKSSALLVKVQGRHREQYRGEKAPDRHALDRAYTIFKLAARIAAAETQHSPAAANGFNGLKSSALSAD
jgi:hypothetical protein